MKKNVHLPVAQQVNAHPPWPWVAAAVYVLVVVMIVLFCHGDDIFNHQRSPGGAPATRSR